MDKSAHRKNSTERGVLTLWRQHRDGKVKTWKESDRARGAHLLETTSGGTSNDTEQEALTLWRRHQEEVRTRKESDSEVHSHSRDGVERYKSGYGKNPTEREVLTNWRRHRE